MEPTGKPGNEELVLDKDDKWALHGARGWCEGDGVPVIWAISTTGG
jgi:hypothetical protein